MTRHIRSGYGDGGFFFTQPVGAGEGYGDGGFFFTQPVGAGGGYGDGGFFFTQPVGAGGGYGAPMVSQRGFCHPAAMASSYGAAPRFGAGPLAGRLGRQGAARGPFVRSGAQRFGVGAGVGAGVAFRGGAGAAISKADLDEVEKLAKALGKSQYWYALRTSYLNPSKRTVESFPVINAAGKPEGDMKPRDKSKLSERSKNEIEQEKARVAAAQADLNAKVGAILGRGITSAQAAALDAFAMQARRVGAFNEIFRNNAKYRSYPNSPALYKLMIMDAGLKFAKGERTKDNAVEVVRDYARLSPMSARPTTDFQNESMDALKGEGYDLSNRALIPLRTGYTEGSFPAELNNLRGSLTTARGYADEALKAARAAVESAPAQAADAGYKPSGAEQPGLPAEESLDVVGVTPAAPPMQPVYTPEEPVESPITIATDTAEEKGEESFFQKNKTAILVGGAVAALFLFRKQLGFGGSPAASKE